MKNIKKNSGISEKEFNIYEYLVKNGSQTAISLSKVFGLTRAIVYKMLKELIKKKVIVKNNQFFDAFHPDILLSRLSVEENKILKQKESLSNLLKDNFDKKIKTFYKDKSFSNLNSELKKEPIKLGYIFLNSDFMPKELISRRSREKFNEDIIINFSNKIRKVKRSVKNDTYLKHKKQKNFVAISIFGKKVAFYSVDKGDNNTGILIEDEGIANMLIEIADAIVASKK